MGVERRRPRRAPVALQIGGSPSSDNCAPRSVGRADNGVRSARRERHRGSSPPSCPATWSSSTTAWRRSTTCAGRPTPSAPGSRPRCCPCSTPSTTPSGAATRAPGCCCGGSEPVPTDERPLRRALRPPTVAPFRDRADAGARLAAEFDPSWRGRPDVVVLGLPRGGVPVAFEVARALGAPLDVLVVRKLGVPGHEELAFGAVASGGLRVLNPEVARTLPRPSVVDDVTAREQRELGGREASYRGDRPAARPGRAHGRAGRRRAGHRGQHAGGGGRRPPAGPGRHRGGRAGGGGVHLRSCCAVGGRRRRVRRHAPTRSWRWAPGTRTSPPPPTTRSAGCWPGPRRRTAD